MADTGSGAEKGALDMAAAVAKDVYTDLAKPAASEIGTGLGTVASLVNVALGPLRIMTEKSKAWQEKAIREIREQVDKSGIPPERLVPPDARIVYASLPQMALTEQEDELRAMFAKLLATSMDSATKSLAHPSFPDVITKLSPVDARLLQILADPEEILGYRITQHIGEEEEIWVTGPKIRISGLDWDLAFANLARLGLGTMRGPAPVMISAKRSSTDRSKFRPFVGNDELNPWEMVDSEWFLRTGRGRQQLLDGIDISMIPDRKDSIVGYVSVSLMLRSFFLTSYGKHFIRACVDSTSKDPLGEDVPSQA